MLLAALCSRKPDFPLKELMIAKHSFLSTKLPKIIKLGVFYRSFHPQGCYGIYKLPLLSNTDMRVSLSQLLKKEMSSKERDSSLMALSIPARSSSIRLARTAPGSTRGVVCFGGGRRKHSFLTEKCYSQLKEEKNPNLKWWNNTGLGLLSPANQAKGIAAMHKWRRHSGRFLQYLLSLLYLLETCFVSPSKSRLIKFPVTVLF